MIKAVFFDLDDTLCDSDTAWRRAERETSQFLRRCVPGVSEEAFTKAWVKVHRELFQQLNAGKRSMAEVRDSRFQCVFKELNLPISKITEELNDFLSTRYIAGLYLYEDVAVLEDLREYHIGIITNGAHDKHIDSQLSKVRHLGLTDRIQSLTISDEGGARKPHIEIFEVACERAGVLPTEAMFVGDSIENDIVGANRADMTSVLIDRKSDTLIPEIANGRPDYSISNLYGVLSCLGHKQE